MIEKIIRAAVQRGATDLHIKAGDVFRARINGDLVALTKQALTPKQTKDIALMLIPIEDDRARIDEILDYDCSWGLTGVGRFRVNILRQRSSFMIVLRVIPFEVPNIEALGLPAASTSMAEASRGLVLLTGNSSSGKSSAIAALLHHANAHTRRHILTLENPIEFLHRDVSCSITQREIGVDTPNLRVGLQAALRQDTDVVVMENLHDADALEFALQSVERSRLVISSLQAADVQSAVRALIALAPEENRGLVRARLAVSLHSVMALRLLPRADGKGRVLATELAFVDDAIREMIVDGGAIDGIAEYLDSDDGQDANHSFAQDLARLVNDGVVKAEIASLVAGTGVERERSRQNGGRQARGRRTAEASS